MTLKTRQPTGAVPWPLVLIEGEEKAGKTWACAEFTTSDRIGRCFWIDLGEGGADEYGAIPGARYEIVEHDGSFPELLANVAEIRDIAAKALADGEKPVVLVIDTMTEEWAILSEWAESRARSSKENKRKLAADPNAEVRVTSNYWNDATSRHRQLMRLLKQFPGIVLMTSHGKQVAVMGADGQPVAGKKEHKVEAQKTLGADASIWLRLFRAERGQIVGGRSVHLKIRPGDDPLALAKDWSLESVIFDVFKCDPSTAHARNITGRKQDSVDPEAMRNEALNPATTVARLKELYTECVRAGLGDVTVMNERNAEEVLRVMIARVGTERAAKTAPPDKPAEPEHVLNPDDPWLDAINGAITVADTEAVEDEMRSAFRAKYGTDPRARGLAAALAGRRREIEAQAGEQVAA